MKNEVDLTDIIWKLAKGFQHRGGNGSGSIQPIDLKAYSVVFQRRNCDGYQWGVWSQGEFIPLDRDHDDALWLCIQWAINEGRFDRLIDEINGL